MYDTIRSNGQFCLSINWKMLCEVWFWHNPVAFWPFSSLSVLKIHSHLCLCVWCCCNCRRTLEDPLYCSIKKIPTFILDNAVFNTNSFQHRLEKKWINLLEAFKKNDALFEWAFLFHSDEKTIKSRAKCNCSFVWICQTFLIAH